MRRQKTSNKRPIIIIVTIILGLTALSFASVYTYNANNSLTNNESGSSAGKSPIDDTPQPESTKGHSSSDQSPDPTPIPSSNKSSVESQITYTGASDNLYRIRVSIQTITDNGTCTLAMKSSTGATYTKSVAVQPLPSTSTCSGFDIPLGELPKGTWTITVTFNSETLTSTTTSEATI